ncbi:glyoxylate/succinic semialdehyde reductase 1-like isoform X2 [Pomacea canaliculata]|uniref:glyoxylate/succinic semialdehyde reductase 1-like isoform X2 n=1 Tax=Pomacea canaliculata TaxID=400727 RepID=UPI000D732925|nr:glyoxylate/succinic semialdehyde reductase 1-like isoform X2 [Pomacea canaliculata]
MAAKFKVGDLVWAKMKGFQAWPGKIIEPKPEVKKPSNKKTHHFVFFFGSENYAWIPEDSVYPYLQFRDKYTEATRIPRGFKEALEAIEDAWQALPERKSLEPKRKPKLQGTLSGSAKTSRSKSEGAVSNHKDIDDIYRLPDDSELAEEPFESVQKKQREIMKKNKLTPSSRKSLPVKRAAPLASSSDHTSPGAAHKKFFVSKVPSAAPTTSPDGEDSSASAPFMDTSAPLYKDEASEARLSPDDSRIQAEEEDDPYLMHEDKEESMMNKLTNKAVIPTPLRIGFLGLGIMGQGMVMNLLRSGHEVTIWNRTAAKTREFSKAGAFRGNSPADVVQSCDITFTCVSDSVAVRDVVFGNQGVLQGITKGKCYVEMSTVDEETVQDVADAVMARGGTFLEAPVCGSRVPALEGQLIILTSGDRKLYDDCYSCFEAMGRKSFYLGNEVGTATRMKLIHNMLLGTMMASLAEGMALAEKVGLDQEDFAEVLSLGSLSCPTINHKAQAILNQRHDPHFPLQHQQKDLRLVLSMGDSVEQPLFLAAAANELYKKARRLGYGEGDISAVYRAACS